CLAQIVGIADQRRAQARYRELKEILEQRRRDLQQEVEKKLREIREVTSYGERQGGLDAAEFGERGVGDDIEFELLRMKNRMIQAIHGALRRLDEGTYGVCFECGD